MKVRITFPWRVGSFHKKITYGLGMALSVGITATAAVLFWIHLLHREALWYGADFTNRLQGTIRRIDQATQATFTGAYYRKLHRHSLLHLALDDDPTMRQYVRTLASIVHNPAGGVAVFTDCPKANRAECYVDFLFGVPNAPTLGDYDPKGRPWYTLTRDHTDWMALTFLADKRSIPGYPHIPTIGFAKRILVDSTTDPDDGIWVVVFTPHATAMHQYGQRFSSPLLDMLFPGQLPAISTLDVFFQPLRFPQRLLMTEGRLSCRGITNGRGLTYEAIVQCPVNGVPVQYTFVKRYDHPIHLWALAAAALLCLYAACCFLMYVVRLEKLNVAKTRLIEQGRLATAIGARLVHDLKKSIISQHPDLLGKYVNLLGHNLRRERETHWIFLTPATCERYLRWIFGPVDVGTATVPTEGPFLEIAYDTVLQLRTTRAWPVFRVPEMAFYRILKNIVENYNAHGAGGLTITMVHISGFVELRAVNAYAEPPRPVADATNLGLAIMHQLMEDNFGPESQMEQRHLPTIYELILRFPV